MNEPTNILIPQFPQAWQLEVDCDLHSSPDDTFKRLQRDEQLLEQLHTDNLAPTLRLWRNHQCLVATVKESRMRRFEHTSKVLAKDGWPVVVRRTGGACVPHGPGVINLSLVYPAPLDGEWQLEDSYRLLCSPLQKLLQSYELPSESGFVEGSFCDGRYNLQVAGQKLVGTAQRWRKSVVEKDSDQKKGYVLAHACLLTDTDIAAATARINQLYRDCKNPKRFIADSCVSLKTLVKGRQLIEDPPSGYSENFVQEVIARLVEILQNDFII
ncbi:MAG: lipoate--protein ligase family protein [Pseudomonadales bacterium]